MMRPAHPKLSIIIPALGTDEQLEDSLVSVLEHRAADSEVLLVFNRPYADPYDLGDEVRFVHAPRRRGWAACVQAAFEQAQGEFIHVLADNVQVTAAWADACLAYFDDPGVASVAPVVLRGGTSQVHNLGVTYERGGRRKLVGAGLADDAPEFEAAAAEVIGPSRAAGFYRRGALERLATAWDVRIGDRLCDVDLALRLREVGYTSRAALDARVVCQGPLPCINGAFRDGRFAERLYRRYTTLSSAKPARLGHMALALGEFARLPLGIAALRFLGRLTVQAESRRGPGVVAADTNETAAVSDETRPRYPDATSSSPTTHRIDSADKRRHEPVARRRRSRRKAA